MNQEIDLQPKTKDVRPKTDRRREFRLLAIIVVCVLGLMLIIIAVQRYIKYRNQAATRAALQLLRALPAPTTDNRLELLDSVWEKDEFGRAAVWKLRIRNNSDLPIGDIKYRTLYYSETGNIVGARSGLIQRLIKPGIVMPFELKDGLVDQYALKASFKVTGWRFVE